MGRAVMWRCQVCGEENPTRWHHFFRRWALYFEWRVTKRLLGTKRAMRRMS